MNKKYFDVLKLKESASLSEVQFAYKTLIDSYNSQLSEDNSDKQYINQKIMEINSAYDYLINNVYKNPNTTHSTLDHIKTLINNNQIDEAREKLWKIEDRDAEWHYLMGQTYYKEGWYDRAKHHFSIAYNIEPNNFEYSQAYNSFNNSNEKFRQQYSQRTNQLDMMGCGCCNTCCNLLCLDSCCECCGCDFISCC